MKQAKLGKYSVNYAKETLIEIDIKRYVIKLVKERYPELYKEAREAIEALYKEVEEELKEVCDVGDK